MKMMAFGLVILGIALLAACVCYTVFLGRRCAVDGMAHVQEHQRMVNYTLGATLILVFFIELFSGLASVHIKDTWLFVVHLFFAVPFLLLLLIMRFWITGVAYRRFHKPLAYTLAGSFIGVLVTGALILRIMAFS